MKQACFFIPDNSIVSPLFSASCRSAQFELIAETEVLLVCLIKSDQTPVCRVVVTNLGLISFLFVTSQRDHFHTLSEQWSEENNLPIVFFCVW